MIKLKRSTPHYGDFVSFSHAKRALQAPSAAQRARDSQDNIIIAILIGTVCYQAFLCFLNTHVLSTSRTLVGLSESLIYLACLPFLLKRLLPNLLVLAFFSTAILCLSMLVSGIYDAKPFRDLAIPFCFFWLGYNIGRPELTERALTYIIGIVVTFGLLETLFLDAYTDVFNIFSYYVSIGNLQPITEYVNNSRLQLNGTRPDGIGRTLLPWLFGPHRVSSVFLEPVSLGNFAAMCAAWGLSRDKHEWRKGVFFVASAMVLIVLADSRFALLSLFIMITVRIIASRRALLLTVFTPLLALLMLLIVGMNTHTMVGDNFQGRLAWTGWALMSFDIPMLMGFNNSKPFADHGWAHVLATFGIPLCIVLWFALWLLPMPDERGSRFRAFVSIYISLILCVSGFSLFALKSAGILWFAMGTLLRRPLLDKPAHTLSAQGISPQGHAHDQKN